MTTIAASALPAGYLKIGDFEFGEDVACRCVVKITAKPKVKLDKKAVDGKSDGTTTNKGKDPCDLDVELTWNGARDDVDAAIEEALYQLSPRGPNSGTPQKVSYKRQRVHGVDSVIVEELDGPHDTPGDDKCTAKIKLVSWTKPAAAGQGAGKTPDAPKGSETVKGFGGTPGNTITITHPNPPAAGGGSSVPTGFVGGAPMVTP